MQIWYHVIIIWTILSILSPATTGRRSRAGPRPCPAVYVVGPRPPNAPMERSVQQSVGVLPAQHGQEHVVSIFHERRRVRRRLDLDEHPRPSLPGTRRERWRPPEVVLAARDPRDGDVCEEPIARVLLWQRGAVSRSTARERCQSQDRIQCVFPRDFRRGSTSEMHHRGERSTREARPIEVDTARSPVPVAHPRPSREEQTGWLGRTQGRHNLWWLLRETPRSERQIWRQRRDVHCQFVGGRL